MGKPTLLRVWLILTLLQDSIWINGTLATSVIDLYPLTWV